jgi:branched-chain amino acid transport system permease protein
VSASEQKRGAALTGDDPAYERFDARMRQRLLALPLEPLIAEHRQRPFGPHSDGLARLLSYFRGAEISGKYVIFGLDGNAGWVLGRIGRPRAEGSVELDMSTVYTSCEDAEHAVLLARVQALREEGGPT